MRREPTANLVRAIENAAMWARIAWTGRGGMMTEKSIREAVIEQDAKFAT